MFNRKKKREKYLNDRKNRIDGLDFNALKSEPFVLEPIDKYPMKTQIDVIGKVISGMYHYGDPIGMESEGQIIHSNNFEMRIPGIGISNEDLDTIYKDDIVEFIFTDIIANLIDENSNVVADSWNKIHGEI